MPKSEERYRHYKGNDYEVLYVGTHTETEEDLVVYRALKDPEKIWIRPLSMFMETVDVNGTTRPRFERLGTGSDSKLQ